MPRTPEDNKRRRTIESSDNGSDCEANNTATSDVVSNFIEAYLVKKVGAAIRLSSLRQLVSEVTGVRLHKKSPLLMQVITDFIKPPKFTAGEVTAMTKARTLPDQYRIESKVRNVQDVKVVGVTLRSKPITAWRQQTHAKHALYNKVVQATKPTFRGADLLAVLSSITQAQNTDADEPSKPIRIAFPITTPGAKEQGFHVTLVEGLFTQVNYKVVGTTVTLECVRVVPAGSSVPSGLYPTTYVLDEPADDQKPVLCRQLHLGLWQVKVPIAQGAALAGEGVAAVDLDEQYRQIMGLGLTGDNDPQEEEQQALLIEEDIEDM
ncbi:hypothetical protein DIPPA_32645 [Diplonema papillatum]|nr:hypothetical protein DIPPA_32645 [Diplonema papillatum]